MSANPTPSRPPSSNSPQSIGSLPLSPTIVSPSFIISPFNVCKAALNPPTFSLSKSIPFSVFLKNATSGAEIAKKAPVIIPPTNANLPNVVNHLPVLISAFPTSPVTDCISFFDFTDAFAKLSNEFLKRSTELKNLPSGPGNPSNALL